MPGIPLSNVSLRLIMGIFIYLVWQLNFIGVLQQEFGFQAALIDSGINLLLLMFSAQIILHTFRFYQPQPNQFWVILSIGAVFSVLLVIFAKLMLPLLIKNNPAYETFLNRTVNIRIGFAILTVCCMLVLSLLWNMLNREVEARERKEETQALAREAELFKLRQQLQPHFLFNSLNSISAMVVTEPGEARKMIEQLSTFLRATINRKDGELINLEEELEQIDRYLVIEKLRFGHRLQTSVNAAEECFSAKLPPLILQPVVENAIKFGLYDTIGEVTINITATCTAESLQITVSNPFDPSTSSSLKGTGFGLNAVKRRLYLLFGRQDLLTTGSEDNLFITTIHIPQVYV
ncbi:sensor histidine kinase [Flavihumibacter petaseus]|uniref:Putative two-component histidine kinase n=1 Tax=Flavihumibacter petaseus NBRC 106054 TaxID=1220578 RepID=A0A0E9MVK5_9BACT|nr:histidine kinase [Flavihumibacter petaseus]GAO41614.1 putative two-component histidine kinase [Flavihumibacter petaseus NBRC 106054]